jgi:hypothetical protein
MPICKDRAASDLHSKGYNLIRYPVAEVNPLDVLGGDRAPLQWLGPLTVVWKSSGDVPVAKTSDAPHFQFERTDEFKSSIGIRILQGLLSNIGGNLDAKASISSTISFTYQSPSRQVIDPLRIGKFLKFGDLDSENVALQRYLDPKSELDQHLYVVSEVLKSRKLLVRVSGSSDVSVAADVKTLQGLAASQTSAAVTQGKTAEIGFEGDTELAFAFRAFEIAYVDGKWSLSGQTEAHMDENPPAAFPATPLSVAGVPASRR